MTVFHMARTAYTPETPSIRSPSSVEYDAFARVTRALKDAGADSAPAAKVSALHANRRLWTHLAAEVADADNALPDELRARLFYLAEFTIHHTSRVLAAEAGPEVLVEINTAVMRGLRQQGGQAG